MELQNFGTVNAYAEVKTQDTETEIFMHGIESETTRGGDSLNYNDIPQEIKKVKQWVARADKIPISPLTLCGAKSTDSRMWGSFEQAISAKDKPCTYKDLKTKELKQGIVNGIGFVFAPPFCGIDIDHCINADTGEIAPEALDIISIMDSYTEFSPSGTGFHIIYKGKIHKDWRKKIANALGEGIHLEMYQQGRYFTFTGDIFDNHTEIKEAEAAAQMVYKAYAEVAQNKYEQNKPAKIRPLPSYNSSLSDSKIIDIASKSNKGFSALWRGDFSGYGSHSEADLALCNILAFYADSGMQVDGLFRQSGLMRDKWDEKRGAKTYGEMTVEKALARQRNHYDPNFSRSRAVHDSKTVIQSNAEPNRSTKFTSITYDEVRKHKVDDIGIASFFASLVKNKLCYVPEYNRFFVYDGEKWKADDKKDSNAGILLIKFVRAVQAVIPPEGYFKAEHPTDENGKLIKDLTEEQQALIDKGKKLEKIANAYRVHYKDLGNANARERLLKDVRKIVSKSINCFDTESKLLNCLNGTYNLETGELQPHNSNDYITMLADVEYNPEAKCERFDRFIEEITENDTEKAEILGELLGYSLSGNPKEECFFVALGTTTRNGKGTLFNTFMEVMGDYSAQIAFETIARTANAKDGSRATPDIARLKGVRYVLSNEPDKGSCFDEALIKQLTGNDRIAGRPLYGDIIEYTPKFVIVITANSVPSIADSSIFESDRLKIIKFNHHFGEGERDTTLKATLREPTAKSAILNWALAGYKRYIERGALKSNSEMLDTVKEIQHENDYIGQFIDERLILHNPSDCHAPKLTVKDIRVDYGYWAADMGIKPIGAKLFKEELKKHNVTILTSHNQDAVRGALKAEEFPTENFS